MCGSLAAGEPDAVDRVLASYNSELEKGEAWERGYHFGISEPVMITIQAEYVMHSVGIHVIK